MRITVFIICTEDDFGVLKQTLEAHSSTGIDVRFLENLTAMREQLRSPIENSRLISFLNHTIIPADILRLFDLGAYNFHPGSPEYPGTAPEAWACYAQDKTFGATLHEMSDKVDEGAIIDVESYPVPPRSHRMIYAQIGRKMAHSLFCKTAKLLASPERIAPNPELKWTGKKRTNADFQSMVQLSPDIEREEFFKRIFCFGPPDIAEFSVTLHGYKFMMMTITGFKGHFDPIHNDLVQGWAINLSNPSQRMELIIKVDDDREFFVTADQYRVDVHDAGHGDGHSGFTWDIPTDYRDGLPHNIEVIAAGMTLMGGPRLYAHKEQ
jgi:methionyl-tRNA formyltransferase